MWKALYVLAAILYVGYFLALFFGFEPEAATIGISFAISAIYFTEAAFKEEG